MKVTETRLDTLIDNLNTLICEDDLLTRQERETRGRAVAAIGAMKARVSMKKGEASTVARREKREKKDRQPDPRFPRAGHPFGMGGLLCAACSLQRAWFDFNVSVLFILCVCFSGTLLPILSGY